MDGVEMTAVEWRQKFLNADDEQQLVLAALVLDHARTSSNCFEMGHEDALNELLNTSVTLQEERRQSDAITNSFLLVLSLTGPVKVSQQQVEEFDSSTVQLRGTPDERYGYTIEAISIESGF